MRTRNKQKTGSASVELVLLLPIFVSLLAFTNIVGSLSRVFTYGSSIGDDMLRFSDNLDYGSLTSNRIAEGGLDTEQIRKMWEFNHPDNELNIDVISLSSQGTPYSASGYTDQNGAFVSDVVSFYEENERLSRARTVLDDSGDVIQTTWRSREGRWLDNFGDPFEFPGSIDLLDQRSHNRSLTLNITSSPWLAKVLPDDLQTLSPSFDIEVHRRRRSFAQPTWHSLSDTTNFHLGLEGFLQSQGEAGATLVTTPHWQVNQQFQIPD